MRITIFCDTGTGYFTLVPGLQTNGEQNYKLEDYSWYQEGEDVGLQHKFTKSPLFKPTHWSEWYIEGSSTGDLLQLTDYLKTNFKPGGGSGEGDNGTNPRYKELVGYISQVNSETPIMRLFPCDFLQTDVTISIVSTGTFNLGLNGITFDLDKIVFIGTSDYANREGISSCFEAITWDRGNSTSSYLQFARNLESIVDFAPQDNYQELLLILRIYN